MFKMLSDLEIISVFLFDWGVREMPFWRLQLHGSNDFRANYLKESTTAVIYNLFNLFKLVMSQ